MEIPRDVFLLMSPVKDGKNPLQTGQLSFPLGYAICYYKKGTEELIIEKHLSKRNIIRKSDKACNNVLASCLIKLDIQFIPFNCLHQTVPEFLMKHPRANRKKRLSRRTDGNGFGAPFDQRRLGRLPVKGRAGAP